MQAILSEHITGVFHSSGMIAPDGRCKTLDSCADGYVRAEARGVLAMETLSEDEMMNVNDVVVARYGGKSRWSKLVINGPEWAYAKSGHSHSSDYSRRDV